MNVVHFSQTPLAGSPIRLVRALNTHTEVRARLIVQNPNHYGGRQFESDLDWMRDRDEAMAAIEAADILHLHRYMDLDRKPFGLDFQALARKGKRLIRQFHESLELIGRRHADRLTEIVNDPLPQLVIAQYHERYYPRARLVPNLIPLDDERYRPAGCAAATPVTIFYAPSSQLSAWRSRWDTKGCPETSRMLQRLARREPSVRLALHRDIPHADCLRLRQACQISIDELVTGSYHLSSLESLAQGLPTLAFLDGRTQETIRRLTGAESLPWVNVRLEDAEVTLAALVADPGLREAVGRESRAWMERHWSDRQMVQHYVRAYRDLLEDPGRFEQPRFDGNDKRQLWLARGVADADWEARFRRQAPVWWRWRLGDVTRRGSGGAPT